MQRFGKKSFLFNNPCWFFYCHEPVKPILRWSLLNEALRHYPKSMPTVGIMWHFTPHNIQINMFCLHATGERRLVEIRWCLSLHVEQLSSPYVYANKSKTNGALSRDTGKRRDVEMLNVYRSRRKPNTAPAGNRNLPAGDETCRERGGWKRVPDYMWMWQRKWHKRWVEEWKTFN